MKRSLYPFYINSKDIGYDVLSKRIKKFVVQHPPDEESDNTDGFINLYVGDGYLYFEYYRRWTVKKYDPGRRRDVPSTQFFIVPVALVKDPYMLLVFTRKRKTRDDIVSMLPIDRDYRSSIEFSNDFIEFLNTVTEDHPWYDDIMDEDIVSRGRRGARTTTHVIAEKYGDYSERFNNLSKEVSFTQYAIVDVALEDVVVQLTIYPGGRLTAGISGKIDLKESAVYISRAVDKLYDRYKKYQELRSK